MKPLRLQTDDGRFDVDPDLDPMGYKYLLGRSAVNRTRLEREAADAEAPASVATTIERGRSDAANDPRYGGFASQWTPFFEALNVIGDNSGKRVKTSVPGLDLPDRDATGRVEMPRVEMPRVTMPRVEMPKLETPRVAMDRLLADTPSRGRGARNPTDDELEALRAASSLKETPSIWGGKTKPTVKPKRYDPSPDFYASLASLQRGR